MVKRNMQAADCKLGLVNGSRECGACTERNKCDYAAKALERRALAEEGIVKSPSMSYPVQEKRMVPLPFSGTPGFC